MAKILVVDDNAGNRKLLVALLSRDGHVTLEAADGLDGLAAARTGRPQLVISDIIMPSMDGYAFVRQLRADPQLSGTPVIFYTAHYHGREAQNLADACRVARVLVKPCPNADILHAVQQVLAGVPESDARSLTGEFEREHLLLITNKLSEKADALAAFNARFAALTQLNLDIVSELDPDVLLTKVCVGARSLLGARYAVLAVAGDPGPFFATSGIDFGGKLPPQPEIDAGAMAHVLAEGRPLRISDPDDHRLSVGLPDGYPPAGAFLVVPLASPTRAYGWLCLADKIGADGFDPDDERLLTALAAQVDRLYRSDQLLNRVYSVMRALNASTMRTRTREALCNEACRLAVEHGRFALASIVMLDHASGGLKPFASACVDNEDSDLAWAVSTAAPDHEALPARVLRSRQPEICNDLQDPGCVVALRDEMLERGFRSVAALPLLVRGTAIGCFVLFSAQRRFFDEWELRLQTELAGGISSALASIDL